MKASELIEILESLIDSHGDCGVYVSDREKYYPGYLPITKCKMDSSDRFIRFVIE